MKPDYCTPDGPKGCAKVSQRRWYGKCPDCPLLQRKAAEPKEEAEAN
jgi:hypothetical protein